MDCLFSAPYSEQDVITYQYKINWNYNEYQLDYSVSLFKIWMMNTPFLHCYIISKTFKRSN